jgi:hypothetical protein
MNSSLKRKVAKLSPLIQARLDMYELAASSSRFGFFERNLPCAFALTTGAGMLALLPSPAQAKIVYTPANTSIVFLNLDLNHDGVSDFQIAYGQSHTTFAAGSLLQAYTDVQGNGIVGKSGGRYFASALRPGARIGPRKTFDGRIMAHVLCRTSKNHTCIYSGPWINGGKGVRNRYLGFKFLIKAQVHYGWARIKVTPHRLNATLTGYAYETIPNKTIIAGKTHGPDVIVRHATLGHLAAGSSARPKP